MHANPSWFRLARGGTRGRFALERRVLPELESEAAAAVLGPGNAPKYLRNAWQAAFGRSPQPNEAFDLAVKAVEAALSQLVIPKDTTATLGKIIRALKHSPDKWALRLSGKDPSNSINAFADYLNVLWSSHMRHGVTDDAARINHSPEDARAAVSIATHIVYLVGDGGFSPAAS